MRDCKFETNVAIVFLHPSKGTHWNTSLHEDYFDSSGLPPPILLTTRFLKRNGNCVLSEK